MNKNKISRGISFGVRIAAFILLVLFFVPSISVSCKNYETELSAFDAAIGNTEPSYDSESESNTEHEDAPAAPWLFIMPVLAIAIGIIATKFHIVTALCSVAHIVMMFIFKGSVEKWVENTFKELAGYIKIRTNDAFTFAIEVSVLIIVAVIVDRTLFYQHKKISVPCEEGIIPPARSDDNDGEDLPPEAISASITEGVSDEVENPSNSN